MATDLPESLAESWRPLDTRTGETSVSLASITAETTLYEPADADGSTATASDIPVRSLFAVDISVSPSLSALGVSPESVLSTAAPKARDQFVDTIEDADLTVEDRRDTLEFEASNGAGGVWYVLDVGYPVAPDGAAGTDRIDAEAHVAVWPLETTFGMAGGILPLEGVADGSDAPGDPTATTGVDVAPERDRETIAALIRTIELGSDGDAVTE